MKTRYTLEEHLRTNITDDTTLLDTWRINKKRFESKLQATVQSFPSYSLHDISHSNNVIDNIECLLGESGIDQLSLTDTWLILHAALLHDWGMILTESQIQKTFDTKDFNDFIERNRFSEDKDLAKAIEDIENVKTEQLMVVDAYNIRNGMTLILSEYFRGCHGENSRRQILNNISCNYNLSYDLIQSRILEILADIVLCHTRDINFVLTLPQQQKGQNKDQFHPRFISMLLRLGDLLDMDNNRFNNALFQTFFDKLPEKSLLHLKKHHSLKELLITDEEIAIKLDCPDTDTYRIARQIVDWLKDDLDFFLLNWNAIVPKKYSGQVPELKKREILVNGKDVGDLQLKFSKEQIHNMLEGYNLYSEQFVCIREVIQNAIDASKIQIYRDIINCKYGKGIEKLLSSPYEAFCNQIFEQYPIYIKVTIDELEIDKLKVCFQICDLGTGINEDSLKNISNVCVSYKNRKKDKEEYLQMPRWLRPTGGFGIGIQSVFTVTDVLQIISKAENEKFGKNIEIVPMKYGGYISVNIDKIRKERGTDVKFDFEIDKSELEYIARKDFIFSKFDCESEKQFYIDYFKSFIMEKFSNNLLTLYLNGEILGDRMCTSSVEPLYVNSNLVYQYCYKEESIGFRFWDKENNILVNFKDISSYKSPNYISFRGVKLSDEQVYFDDEMNLELDIYGEDVQDCLVYSRNKLNYLYRKKFDMICNNITRKVVEVYIDILERGLECRRKWEVLYVYLLAIKYNLDFNYKGINVSLPIYKLKDDSYSLEYVDLMIYVELLSKNFYILIAEKENFFSYEDIEQKILDERMGKNVCGVLNEEKISSKPQYIICDQCFLGIVSKMCMFVSEDRYLNFRLLECNMNKGNKRLYRNCDVEEFYDDLLSAYKFMIRCVPAIGLEKFSMLEVNIDSVFGRNFYYYQIISPLIESDIDKIKGCSKEKFTNSIIDRPSFVNVVNKVYDKQKDVERYNHEEIKKGYIELIGELYDYFNSKNVI